MQIIAGFLKIIAASNFTWRLYRPFAEVNADVYYRKKQEERENLKNQFFEKYKYLLSDTVKNGPFKGLKYPFQNAIHSTLFPKLLGYYELELQPILNKVFQKSYQVIIDIGSAEGYYAVGMAKKYPKSVTYAVDINSEARKKTKYLANYNGIEDSRNFQILDEITTDFLFNLDPTERHLIFSDCEGFEVSLFTEDIISKLKKSDFIIEIHDFIVPGASDLLIKRFESTHQVQVVKSIDDRFKYREINDLEISQLPLSDQIQLLEEKRPCQMEWIYCESRIN